MSEATIAIARDFTTVPAGRYRTDGQYSGEVFRDDYLIPRLEKGDVIVVLDGTEGYGSSFLEEAFGGLIRKGWKVDELKKHMRIEAKSDEYDRYRRRAWQYIEDAARH